MSTLNENKNCRPTSWCYHSQCQSTKLTTFGRMYFTYPVGNKIQKINIDRAFHRRELHDLLSVYPRPTRLSLGEFDYDIKLWNQLVTVIGPKLTCLTMWNQPSITAEMMTNLFTVAKQLRFLRVINSFHSNGFDGPRLESLTACCSLKELCLISDPTPYDFYYLCLNDVATAVELLPRYADALNQLMPVLSVQQAYVGALLKLQELGVRIDQLCYLERLIINDDVFHQQKLLKLLSLKWLRIIVEHVNNKKGINLLKTLSFIEIPAVEQLTIKFDSLKVFPDEDYNRFWMEEFFIVVKSIRPLIQTLKLLRFNIYDLCQSQMVEHCDWSTKQRVIDKLIEIRRENSNLEWTFLFLTDFREARDWESILKSPINNKILNSKIIFETAKAPHDVSIVWSIRKIVGDDSRANQVLIKYLPDDVIKMHVFKYFNTKEILAFERVSRNFQYLALETIVQKNKIDYLLIAKLFTRFRKYLIKCQRSKCEISSKVQIGEFDYHKIKDLMNKNSYYEQQLEKINFKLPIKCISLGLLNVTTDLWTWLVNSVVDHLQCLRLVVQDSISAQMMVRLFQAAENLRFVELIGYLVGEKLEAIEYIKLNVKISLVIEISYFQTALFYLTYNLNLPFHNSRFSKSIDVLNSRLPQIRLKIANHHSLEQFQLLGVDFTQLRTLQIFYLSMLNEDHNAYDWQIHYYFKGFVLLNLSSLTIDGCNRYSSLKYLLRRLKLPKLKQIKIIQNVNNQWFSLPKLIEVFVGILLSKSFDEVKVFEKLIISLISDESVKKLSPIIFSFNVKLEIVKILLKKQQKLCDSNELSFYLTVKFVTTFDEIKEWRHIFAEQTKDVLNNSYLNIRRVNELIDNEIIDLFLVEIVVKFSLTDQWETPFDGLVRFFSKVTQNFNSYIDLGLD